MRVSEPSDTAIPATYSAKRLSEALLSLERLLDNFSILLVHRQKSLSVRRGILDTYAIHVSFHRISLSRATHYLLRLRTRLGTRRSGSSSHALDGSQSGLLNVCFKCLTKRVETVRNSREKQPDSGEVFMELVLAETRREKIRDAHLRFGRHRASSGTLLAEAAYGR